MEKNGLSELTYSEGKAVYTLKKEKMEYLVNFQRLLKKIIKKLKQKIYQKMLLNPP